MKDHFVKGFYTLDMTIHCYILLVNMFTSYSMHFSDKTTARTCNVLNKRRVIKDPMKLLIASRVQHTTPKDYSLKYCSEIRSEIPLEKG